MVIDFNSPNGPNGAGRSSQAGGAEVYRTSGNRRASPAHTKPGETCLKSPSCALVHISSMSNLPTF